MDDLDHSMYIAEYDWTSFCEESEECVLLQPSLACLDSSGLSDSEDSGNLSSVLSTGQQESQQSDEAESNIAEHCIEGVQINQSGSGGERNDLITKAEEDSEICFDYPGGNAINAEGVHVRTAGHVTEGSNKDITSLLQTEQLNVKTSDGESAELKKVGYMQMGSDSSSIHEPDPLSCRRTELNVSELQSTDGAVSEDVSGVALRAEKERWFVTVSDSPARQRARVTSVKKKQRQKKTCKNNRTCQTKSCATDLEVAITNESEGGRHTESVTQSNQNSRGNPSAEENPESVQVGVTSHLSQMSSTPGEEDNLSDKLLTSHIAEPTERNKHEASSSAFTSHDTFTAKDLDSDGLESDELGDSVEFLSIHSYDSESYLSASESVEDSQHFLMQSQQLQSSSFLTQKSCLTENTDADDTPDREMHSCHNTLSCIVTDTYSEAYESTNVVKAPTLTFPSAAQSADKMPDADSTCDYDTHCTQLRMPSDTHGLQKHEINLSASGCSSLDQLSPPPVPDVTVTPCSVADSPETYALAAGHTRPVYAISAFWDEMEKLTINDILQLRMGRSTPPRDKQETVSPNVDDFPTNHNSLVDALDYNLSDGALIDTSDTADSDYFTQPDESKADRSSCEFSTSDFEEEYWQFLGASRNPSPDPQCKNQKHEEEESTASEGKETPVPSEDFAGKDFEDSDAFASSELMWPRQITKSKSVSNVHALNTKDASSLGNDESSLFLSSCPSLEENTLLKGNGSLGKLTPAALLSKTDILEEHTQISFPEMFECFITENEAKRDTRCVAVCDPENISVAPLFDYTVCTIRDEASLSFLCDSKCSEEKPIPIFSCSHPTVRELTFPNYVFLSADCKEVDGISPLRVASHSFIQANDYGMSAAAPRGFHSWKSLLPIRKICFHDKGSIRCRGSGVWVFPAQAEKIIIKTADPPVTMITEKSVSSSPSQLCKELAVQQRILETMQTRPEGIFSTLKQSDMCLVCIAFASWVLRSSDPEADDAWKAALLANVSALSAIQYLRQFVKKKNPSQDDP
uniref:uncharacterized protein LOC124056307 n=1 Tax=Scatophagus argus TaxID=75038 RepID=UPI001ED7D3B6|nr:uncharacterized protein LOC124056307 [Scatophagus argus]